MKNNKITLTLLASLFLISCSEEKEDITKDIDKAGSVEVVMHSDFINDKFDLITIKHKVWKDGKVILEKVSYDTVPTLGSKKMFVEDSLGNESEHMMPKNYDFFVTVQ